jgi:glycosyltransferase involved in cell wall biosynthesis
MKSFSVIVTAHNNETVLQRTLQSVEEAITYRAARQPSFHWQDAEIVVVDDGSTDGTLQILRDFSAGKPFYTVVHRPQSSSPSCARNTGVAASTGEFLFFLDGDDLFLPSHIDACWRELQAPNWQFVKTGVRLQDPVHPDWKVRIEHSLVINFCVRRTCHEAVGGFPDYHLFVRHGDDYTHRVDIFYKVEDQFYSELVCSLFPGVKVLAETVEHLRYPGNTFDRQYAKFCQPFGQYREMLAPEHRFRLGLAELITRYQLDTLRARLPTSHPATAG